MADAGQASRKATSSVAVAVGAMSSVGTLSPQLEGTRRPRRRTRGGMYATRASRLSGPKEKSARTRVFRRNWLTGLTDSLSMSTPLELTGDALPERVLALGRKAPDSLYVWGPKPSPRGPAIALVGTRRASPECLDFARKLAKEVAEAGVTVLSGGALGVDTASHEGALDAGGNTVVVAPTWLEHPYPAENRDLYARVIESGGTYLTPTSASDQLPHPRLFFLRNAVMVAYADAVVVVEAGFRSGARNAASWARQLGKPLYVVPHAPWNPHGGGCLDEIRRGARMLTRSKEILEEVLKRQGIFPGIMDDSPARSLRSTQKAKRRTPRSKENLRAPMSSVERGTDAARTGIEAALKGLESGEDLVRETVGYEPLSATQICDRSGLPPAQVQTLLLTLTLQGVLVCTRSGRYRAAAH